MNDARVIEDYDIRSSLLNLSRIEVNEKLKKSASDAVLNGAQEPQECGNVNQLSKSLGATHINSDEEFSDAQQEIFRGLDHSKSVFVNAAMSIDYANCPPTSKYIRGDNIMSCWAMRPVQGDESSSIFEWLLCIDLKGSLPKYVLNTVSCGSVRRGKREVEFASETCWESVKVRRIFQNFLKLLRSLK
jgi:hypothetical protein